MTYEEFKKIVEDTGKYYVTEDDNSVFVTMNHFSKWSIRISQRINNFTEFQIDAYGKNDGDIIRTVLEFAETPLEKRGPKKRYYLKHKFMVSELSNSRAYLILKNRDEYYLGSIILCDKQQATFAKKEIEEIKNKYDVTLSDFELVEVEDE